MKITIMRIGLCAASLLSANAMGQAARPWEQPAAALAGQIADLMGPGQARLTIRDPSSLPADEIPVIRKLLEQDLKSHGVTASGAESANAIRVTLSENARAQLWVAEVIQGNETRVTMVDVKVGAASAAAQARGGLVLRTQTILESQSPVVAMLEAGNGIVALEPEAIVLYSRVGDGWQEQKRLPIRQRRALSRDARGAMDWKAAGDGFDAYLPGTACASLYSPGSIPTNFSMECHDSDDPWPILRLLMATDTGGEHPDALSAFYNAARDYFTGVVTPAAGADLPPFYSAALLPRPAGVGLLIDGIDGKVQMAESGALKTVAGTRDWGSDLAVLHSGCGAGDQVIASGSGEAISDSLRAYEVPALEAVPASAPLAMDGTVTALWAAPDSKSVYASVRHTDGSYEVERVTALCD